MARDLDYFMYSLFILYKINPTPIYSPLAVRAHELFSNNEILVYTLLPQTIVRNKATASFPPTIKMIL